MPTPPSRQPPVVAVLPTKFVAGATDLADEHVEAMLIKPFEEAFRGQYVTDAHFVCYRASFADEWPRINKPLLPKVRLLGGDILTTMFAFDYDNPGHRAWTGPDEWEGWVSKLVEIAADWAIAGQWTLVYATKHGARLVYVLNEEIPADKGEGHHRWMVSQFTQRGMRLDPKCSDWTRVFRLPFVMRDGKPTWTYPEATWSMCQYDARLSDVLKLPTIDGNDRSAYGDIQPLDTEKPDKHDCLALIRTPGGQNTEWCKNARKHLRGRESFDVIFNNVPLPKAGGRDNAMHKHVGQVIGILIDHEVEGVSPEHVYGLFIESVEQLEPDADTPDWTNVLWDHIKRLWAKQQAKIREAEEVVEIMSQSEAATSQEAMSKWEKIIFGMREWCENKQLQSNEDNGRVAIDWASQHLIIGIGQLYYVIAENGRYFAEALFADHVIPHIHRHGLTDIIPTVAAVDGMSRPKSLREIMADSGTIAHDIRLTPQQLPGGYLENEDTAEAQVVCPMFMRNTNLPPTYDPQVDEWLKNLFGLDYDLAQRWIANALAFDEGGIAALSIKGAQGCGKKMLVQGLAECLTRPALADHNDLTSTYQYGLLKSPFLVINEGFPRINKEVTPYHTFRLLVSGDGIRANRRYRHPVDVRCPYRLIFTANNDNIVESLIGQGSLSPEDREALAIRLIHMEVGDKATQWLRARGGMMLTARSGRRWISGDGGEESDFIVAKHFLYLYERRRELGPRGARLLVEGNCGADIMFRLRTQGGAAPLVIEALVAMLRETPMRDGICIDEDRLYVLPQEVLDYYRLRMGNTTREILTGNHLKAVLRGLCLREFANAITIKSRIKMGRVRWMELDPAAILSAADRLGNRCPPLAELVERQKLVIPKDQT